MTLLTFIENGVPVVAFLLMLAVGLDVTPADLARVAARRGLIAGATLAQAVILPSLAFLVLRLVPATPEIGSALLLVAACPGGGMSNVYVYLARASTALSVTLTAVSCVAAVVSMPAVMAVYGAAAAVDGAFAVPLPALLGQLLIMAVIPVSAGAWLRYRRPKIEQRFGVMLRRMTAVGVVAIVAAGLAQSRGELAEVVREGGPVAALLVGAGLAAGWLTGVLVRAPRGDRFALLAEFGVRNLAIAMVIEVTLRGNPGFIAFGAIVLFVQAASLMTAAKVFRTASVAVAVAGR